MAEGRGRKRITNTSADPGIPRRTNTEDLWRISWNPPLPPTRGIWSRRRAWIGNIRGAIIGGGGYPSTRGEEGEEEDETKIQDIFWVGKKGGKIGVLGGVEEAVQRRMIC